MDKKVIEGIMNLKIVKKLYKDMRLVIMSIMDVLLNILIKQI